MQGSQSKSPFLGGLSPLPSPASVGSTASTSSGGGGPSHSTDFTGSSVTLPRHIFNKAAEHLVISTLINTCLELWRLSDSYMEQCRGGGQTKGSEFDNALLCSICRASL